MAPQSTRILAWVLALQAGFLPASLLATPVTYDFQGTLTLGAVGSNASGLASHLSPAAFGAFSASITYDGDTLQFSQNVTMTTSGGPVIIGAIYDVTGSATVKLANGTGLTASSLRETVWNDLAPWGSSFGVSAGFSIPNSIWQGAVPLDCGTTSNPVCWLPMLSYLDFSTGGALAANAAPPRSLDGATTSGFDGLILTDRNDDGLVDLASETISLNGNATRVTAVPEPSGLALLSLALPLLAWSRRARSGVLVPWMKSRPVTVEDVAPD